MEKKYLELVDVKNIVLKMNILMVRINNILDTAE